MTPKPASHKGHDYEPCVTESLFHVEHSSRRCALATRNCSTWNKAAKSTSMFHVKQRRAVGMLLDLGQGSTSSSGEEGLNFSNDAAPERHHAGNENNADDD